MKKIHVVFIILCFAFCLVPSVGMVFTSVGDKTESGDENAVPTLKDETGEINEDFLSDLGDYFEDNFAFRDRFVDANALVYGKAFNTSTTDQVVLGSDDWMFYSNTLNDYKSDHLMSDRGLFNIVHNLSLMQDYVNENGSKFILTIAPNKNSLYGEHMPYNYALSDSEDANNMERLEPLLAEAGINYVNLFEVFEETDEELYLKQDSHWNNVGAALAFDKIMQQTDLEYEDYSSLSYTIKKDHEGDLAAMVYPNSLSTEENYYYDKDWNYEYVYDVTDNMDDWIETISDKNADASLLMYRDSFGESWLPFFADEFGYACFSRLVPYDMNDIIDYQPTYTVVERVERRLSSFAESPIIMEPQEIDLLTADYESSATTVHVVLDGDNYLISGIVDEAWMKADTEIYVSLDTGDGVNHSYQACYISQNMEDGSVNDNGYGIYIPTGKITEDEFHVSVLVKNGDEVKNIAYAKVEVS